MTRACSERSAIMWALYCERGSKNGTANFISEINLQRQAVDPIPLCLVFDLHGSFTIINQLQFATKSLSIWEKKRRKQKGGK